MDAKALLDSLMGPSRDKPMKEQNRGDGWKDKTTCKHFLVGFCATNANANWFKNTKNRDVEQCTKVHSERLKADFEKHADRKEYQLQYEREFLRYLEGLIRGADAWIAREKAAAKPAPSERITKLPPASERIVYRIQDELNTALKQAEGLAENGKISESKQAAEEANHLQAKIDKMKEDYSYVCKGDYVCEVCGIRINLDEPAAQEAHHISKLHDAYLRIRNKADEVREKLKNEPGGDASQDTRAERSDTKDRRDRNNRDRDSERSDNKEKERTDRSNRDSDRSNNRDSDRNDRNVRDSDRSRQGDNDRSDRGARDRHADIDRSDRGNRDRERSPRRDRGGDRERDSDRRGRDCDRDRRRGD